MRKTLQLGRAITGPVMVILKDVSSVHGGKVPQAQEKTRCIILGLKGIAVAIDRSLLLILDVGKLSMDLQIRCDIP